MAYATLAGLAVQIGLYTAILPMIAYAMLGSSRRLSVSTTTTIGILTAAEVSQVSPDASAAQAAATVTTLAVLVGLALVLAAVLRLGFVARFISEPVLTGFKAGIGIVIVVDQVPKLFGLHLHKGSVLQTITELVANLPHTSRPTLMLAAVTIAVMLLISKFVPRAPSPLAAVILGIAASGLLALQARGVEAIGAIPSGLPAFTPPDVNLARLLWPGALGIALMSFTESIAAGRAFAKAGKVLRTRTRSCWRLASAMPSAVCSARCLLVAVRRRPRSTRARVRARRCRRIVTAAATLLVILFLAPLIALMPQATLAAVVIVTSIGLIAPADFAAIRRVRTVEFRWAVAAMLGVIVLGTLPGILAAVVLSMVSLLRQSNDPAVHVLGRKPGTDVFRPRTTEHASDESIAGHLLLRPEGRIYFGNAQRGRRQSPAARAEHPGAHGRARYERGAGHRVHRTEVSDGARGVAARVGPRPDARGTESRGARRHSAGPTR